MGRFAARPSSQFRPQNVLRSQCAQPGRPPRFRLRSESGELPNVKHDDARLRDSVESRRRGRAWPQRRLDSADHLPSAMLTRQLPRSLRRRRSSQLPPPPLEAYRLQEAREIIAATNATESAKKDESTSSEHTDPRSAMRFDWQAPTFQLKQSQNGAAGKFGIREQRKLQWPAIERHEEETPVVARPLMRRRRRSRVSRSESPEPRLDAKEDEVPTKTGQAALSELAEPQVRKQSSSPLPRTTWPKLLIRSSTQERESTIGTEGTASVHAEEVVASMQSNVSSERVIPAQRFPMAFASQSVLKGADRDRASRPELLKIWAQESTALRSEEVDTKVGIREGRGYDLVSPVEDKVAQTTANKTASVVVEGVSSNLKPTDFTRILAPGLTNWSLQIEKIEQLRHEYTLQPLNSYRLNFKTDKAATAYLETLQRLQRLGNFKLDNKPEHSASPANVDTDLKSKPEADPETDLKTNTIAPPTLRGMTIKRDSIDEQDPLDADERTRLTWTERLQSRLRLKSDLDRPPLVLVDVYPPSGFNFDLQKVIKRDTESIEDWGVLSIVSLQNMLLHDRKPKAPDRILNQNLLVRGRYIVKCRSADEAKRFHRSWNNRVVPWSARYFRGQEHQDHVLYTSILEW